MSRRPGILRWQAILYQSEANDKLTHADLQGRMRTIMSVPCVRDMVMVCDGRTKGFYISLSIYISHPVAVQVMGMTLVRHGLTDHRLYYLNLTAFR